ncbi:MAG TPA: TRAP transporter large permease subunit [Thiolinea sp.]|nr:TRAP transporter large permease subunit [Thiolinea sp.]
MELVFLGLLLLLMMWALLAGYPVAFALPGSAIITVTLAALSGWLFAGDTSAYFAGDGPTQWLSAGVTNFRSLYWGVDRDTLIAIPLFIFMGIMLQRSRIAEDLLVAMAQLFGPLPGGLGISVIFVGALLAATTGIVGATVVAMGLISLPAMLKNNYSKPLACGTICASGTLGQIIPPSIVLIILADQLSSASDQANTARKALYRQITGEFSMPSRFEVVSASAGDMFMGALIPGLILVGIYILYILIVAWIRPKLAPPVPYEGAYDRQFARRVLVALVPPLALIFIVLGSILAGVATVNQAGAIGAVGAIIMAGYRMYEGKWGRYLPAILGFIAIITIAILKSRYSLNIKSIQNEAEWQAIQMALVAVGVLLLAVLWSIVRVRRTGNILWEVMVETAKTTSMVFIILLGAAMLTSAFRAFGGEELVKHYLTSLPGGFWTQFLVVMLVIFLLGFFLDFIEICVVVVPIVAPILLLNPEANITAVWLGVMVGLNIQTSFLTPPFGFALFYLRGVADKTIRTLDIYKGALAFIVLQLIGLAIVGYYPSLVNYLPNRSYLTSENAPPPINPKLQVCLEDYTFSELEGSADTIRTALEQVSASDLSVLPDKLQTDLQAGISELGQGFDRLEEVRTARNEQENFAQEYHPVHQKLRNAQALMARIDRQIAEQEQGLARLGENATDSEREAQQKAVNALKAARVREENALPANDEQMHSRYQELSTALGKARNAYFMTVDGAYDKLRTVRQAIEGGEALKTLEPDLAALAGELASLDPEQGMARIEALENRLSDVKESSAVKSPLTRARRLLKKPGDDRAATQAEVGVLVAESRAALTGELAWRDKAVTALLPVVRELDDAVRPTFGARSQTRLSRDQATDIAACLSHHRDVSLNF